MRTRRHSFQTAVVLIVTVALSGCSEAEPAQPQGVEHTVSVTAMTFEPAELTISVGDTVTWVIDDQGRPHDVVANDRSFQSALIEQGEFSHTFTEAGTYDYFCTPHPGKEGVITVEER